jgi:hypothetical protein
MPAIPDSVLIPLVVIGGLAALGYALWQLFVRPYRTDYPALAALLDPEQRYRNGERFRQARRRVGLYGALPLGSAAGLWLLLLFVMGSPELAAWGLGLLMAGFAGLILWASEAFRCPFCQTLPMGGGPYFNGLVLDPPYCKVCGLPLSADEAARP